MMTGRRPVFASLLGCLAALSLGCDANVRHVTYDCLCECFRCEEYDPLTSECIRQSADREPFPSSACVPEGTDPDVACLEDCEIFGFDCQASLFSEDIGVCRE
jgi:hypothetical protein